MTYMKSEMPDFSHFFPDDFDTQKKGMSRKTYGH